MDDSEALIAEYLSEKQMIANRQGVAIIHSYVSFQVKLSVFSRTWIEGKDPFIPLIPLIPWKCDQLKSLH